jgi:hypothetical protein
VLCVSTGCITIAGDELEDVFVPPASFAPYVEHTVDPSFSFELDGGKMITSNKAGRDVNQAIMSRWKEEGRIKDHLYVKQATRASGTADYLVTLRGTQHGESNEVMQFFSGFTLGVLPYWVDTHYNLQYTVTERATGRTYQGSARESYTTVVSLLLLPVTPFLQGGRGKAFARLGDHLYLQLSEQGAFRKPGGTRLPPPRSAELRKSLTPDRRPSAERLRELQELRSEKRISDEEYWARRRAILNGL